jgi:hypothetical protein
MKAAKSTLPEPRQCDVLFQAIKIKSYIAPFDKPGKVTELVG